MAQVNDTAVSGKQFFRPVTETAVEMTKELLKTAEREAKKASYKIELAYSWNRSAHEPSPGLIRIWKSGKKLRGGGDVSMGWCGYPDCGKPIEPEHLAGEVAFCPACNRPLYGSMEDREIAITSMRSLGHLTDEMEKRATLVMVKAVKLIPERMSEVLEKMWRDLHCDADLYVKFFKKSIRYRAGDPRASDILREARTHRDYVVYENDRLLRDTVSGAPARDRILAFLRA